MSLCLENSETSVPPQLSQRSVLKNEADTWKLLLDLWKGSVPRHHCHTHHTSDNSPPSLCPILPTCHQRVVTSLYFWVSTELNASLQSCFLLDSQEWSVISKTSSRVEKGKKNYSAWERQRKLYDCKSSHLWSVSCKFSLASDPRRKKSASKQHVHSTQNTLNVGCWCIPHTSISILTLLLGDFTALGTPKFPS